MKMRISHHFSRTRIEFHATWSAEAFFIDRARLTDFVEYDPAYAIKFTILRLRPSGSTGDADVFGAQQYAPFLDIDVRGT
ncbi:DUF4387 family protein [Ciceribacter azotifigens]|uniref:DUF4387 family protein n=1 Tax=Ciceribacter azotifigens TaxID=2069303 RepID=UPI003A8AABAA